MTQVPRLDSSVDMQAPLTNFSQCHSGITSALNTLAELPALLSPADRARQIAADTLAFFGRVVYEHHKEEEVELFPAVLRSAQKGEEHDRVQAMTERLTREHRAVEAAWKRLEPALKDVAKGHHADLDAAGVQDLVATYLAHAQFEERHFLPLSETILKRDDNHMFALGLSLHMRHAPPVVGYL